MDFPYFIVISGAPATGKTTLGYKLKEYYNLPFIYKDFIKESLFDTLGIIDSEWSGKLGKASMVLIYKLLEQNLSAKKSILFESAFFGKQESERIRVIIEKYGAYPIEIHCSGTKEKIIERFMRREKSVERHKGHHRKNVLPDLEKRLDTNLYSSLGLNSKIINKNTDDFSKIDFNGLVNKITEFTTIV